MAGHPLLSNSGVASSSFHSYLFLSINSATHTTCDYSCLQNKARLRDGLAWWTRHSAILPYSGKREHPCFSKCHDLQAVLSMKNVQAESTQLVLYFTAGGSFATPLYNWRMPCLQSKGTYFTCRKNRILIHWLFWVIWHGVWVVDLKGTTLGLSRQLSCK